MADVAAACDAVHMTALTLKRWSAQDLVLLRRGNTVEMTRHLNGPETEAQVVERHKKYLRLWKEGEARTFSIVEGEQALGSIAFWNSEWRGTPVFEAGWFVLPEAQGRGVASRALVLVIEEARTLTGERNLLTAFPAVANAPSNGVCRRAGFTLVGTKSAEFRGGTLQLNEWILDLTTMTP